MTKSNVLLGAVISSLLFTACSKLSFDGKEVDGAKTQNQGIINGETVSAEEDISKTTVQIFTFQIQEDLQGRAFIKNFGNCTGTLLDQDILLTAAHCTSWNPEYMVLYFSKDAPQNMKEFLQTMHENPLVRRVVGGKVGNRWPRMRPTQNDWGDIALLKFEGGLPDGYQTAELLPANESLQVAQPTTLAGFGVTNGFKNTSSNQLLKVEVSILKPHHSPTEMIIDSGDKGPCRGDSGGPAFVTGTDGKKYVAGVTSRADLETDPKAQCVGDTIYTKVQPYATWITRSKQYLQSAAFRPEAIPQPFGL